MEIKRVKITQGRYKHSVVSLDVGTANAMIERGEAREYVEPVTPAKVTEPGHPDFDALQLSELRELAPKYGVVASGNTRTLRKRIKEAAYGM